MALTSKNRKAQTKATFSVTKEILKLYSQTGSPTSERITGIDPAAIKKIEESLKLTFLSEKDEDSHVCMANNPEVRNEFKDIFDLKDVLNYTNAVLHSPNYFEKYKDLSKHNFYEIPYPNDINFFWKLADLGEKLRHIKLSNLYFIRNQNEEIDKILKKIAEIKTE